MNKQLISKELIKSNLVNKPLNKKGRIEGVYQPPKSYGFLRRVKWWVWDNN